MNISLGCWLKSHIPYAWNSIIVIGTYLQNHRKNFKILLLYLLPLFIISCITSLTSIPCINRRISFSFSYLHLSLVFLLKRLIFQGFPTFEFSFLFKVSSQIFSYFLMFFPAILVNPLVKQASLPTGFFNYSLSDILLPLHHQNSHGCKCSRLH